MGKGTQGLTPGILDIIGSAESKNKNSKELENMGVKEEKKKRSYMLKKSTIKKLEELKVYNYPEGTDYGIIVDEAICELYKIKKGI
jgi:hypothetical protein